MDALVLPSNMSSEDFLVRAKSTLKPLVRAALLAAHKLAAFNSLPRRAIRDLDGVSKVRAESGHRIGVQPHIAKFLVRLIHAQGLQHRRPQIVRFLLVLRFTASHQRIYGFLYLRVFLRRRCDFFLRSREFRVRLQPGNQRIVPVARGDLQFLVDNFLRRRLQVTRREPFVAV